MIREKECGLFCANLYLRKKVLDTAKDFCKGETNRIIVESTMKVAMEKAQSIDWLMDPTLLENVDNISYLCWISVRDENLQPSFEAFKSEMLKDWEANFNECMDAVILVNPTLLGRTKAQPQQLKPKKQPSPKKKSTSS